MNKQKKVFIIAEAGVNHNGRIELAKKMIDEAYKAGADAVKFQTFTAEKIVSKIASKADYQIKNTRNNESQFDMLKKLELSFEAHKILFNYSKEVGIIFLSTPFDLDSIDFLYKLGIRLWKIPSGEITNYPYIKKLALLNNNYIISTGMSKLGEIEDCLNIFLRNGVSREQITLLHCNTEYPTPLSDVNLKSMLTIQNAFQVRIGYSDHTQGIEVPLAAVSLGATIIEKHFTLDKNMDGPDHKASLDPDELNKMIKYIRNIELSLGDGIKKPSDSESKNIIVARKSIVALKEINEGEVFTENNLTVKRPGTGINPMLWETVLGRNAKRNFKEDELIEI